MTSLAANNIKKASLVLPSQCNKNREMYAIDLAYISRQILPIYKAAISYRHWNPIPLRRARAIIQ